MRNFQLLYLKTSCVFEFSAHFSAHFSHFFVVLFAHVVLCRFRWSALRAHSRPLRPSHANRKSTRGLRRGAPSNASHSVSPVFPQRLSSWSDRCSRALPSPRGDREGVTDRAKVCSPLPISCVLLLRENDPPRPPPLPRRVHCRGLCGCLRLRLGV